MADDFYEMFAPPCPDVDTLIEADDISGLIAALGYKCHYEARYGEYNPENREENLFLAVTLANVQSVTDCVRTKAYNALIRIGARTVPLLRESLSNDDPFIRRRVAAALADLEWQPQTREEWYTIRTAAYQWEPLMDDYPDAETYAFVLKSVPYTNAAIIAKTRLIQLGAGCSGQVVPLLQDGSDKVRSEAVHVLKLVGWTPQSLEEKLLSLAALHKWDALVEEGRGAIDYVALLLRDELGWVRKEAALTLGGIGGPEALRLLDQQLERERQRDSLFELDVREAFESAIRTIREALA
jgi:HEAT repeat protein